MDMWAASTVMLWMLFNSDIWRSLGVLRNDAIAGLLFVFNTDRLAAGRALCNIVVWCPSTYAAADLDNNYRHPLAGTRLPALFVSRFFSFCCLLSQQQQQAGSRVFRLPCIIRWNERLLTAAVRYFLDPLISDKRELYKTWQKEMTRETRPAAVAREKILY